MKDFMANQFQYKGINGCYLEHNRRNNKNIIGLCVSSYYEMSPGQTIQDDVIFH